MKATIMMRTMTWGQDKAHEACGPARVQPQGRTGWEGTGRRRAPLSHTLGALPFHASTVPLPLSALPSPPLTLPLSAATKQKISDHNFPTPDTVRFVSSSFYAYVFVCVCALWSVSVYVSVSGCVCVKRERETRDLGKLDLIWSTGCTLERNESSRELGT